MNNLEFRSIKQSITVKLSELSVYQLVGSILIVFFVFFLLIHFFICGINRENASNFKSDKEETKNLLFEEIKYVKIPKSLNYKDLFN